MFKKAPKSVRRYGAGGKEGCGRGRYDATKIWVHHRAGSDPQRDWSDLRLDLT